MADVAPGYLETLRGVVDKYVYHREDETIENPNYIHNSEATGEEGSESLQGVLQADLTALRAAYGWTLGGEVLTYNPITDRWGIQSGDYVL